VAPSGECLRGYKPGGIVSSRIAPRVATSCPVTWPASRYFLCCPAYQLNSGRRHTSPIVVML